jgi:hypothetical protein
MCLWNEPIQIPKRCYEISNGRTKERRTSICPVLDWNRPRDQSPWRHGGGGGGGRMKAEIIGALIPLDCVTRNVT